MAGVAVAIVRSLMDLISLNIMALRNIMPPVKLGWRIQLLLTIQQIAIVRNHRMIQSHWMKQSNWLMDAWPIGFRLTTSRRAKWTLVPNQTWPNAQDKFRYNAQITILLMCPKTVWMEVSAHLAGAKNLKERLLLLTSKIVAGWLAALLPKTTQFQRLHHNQMSQNLLYKIQPDASVTGLKLTISGKVKKISALLQTKLNALIKQGLNAQIMTSPTCTQIAWSLKIAINAGAKNQTVKLCQIIPSLRLPTIPAASNGDQIQTIY